jgi:hypothetical protein
MTVINLRKFPQSKIVTLNAFNIDLMHEEESLNVKYTDTPLLTTGYFMITPLQIENIILKIYLIYLTY